MFSRGHLDHATAVLFRELEPPVQGQFLDLGCGYGAIGLAIARAVPLATVTAVDVNERALLLANENAARWDSTRGSSPRCRSRLPSDMTFDEIWSNPPIRIGKAALHELLLTWLPRLRPDGRAVMVVGKNLGADSLQRWLGEQGWPDDAAGQRQGVPGAGDASRLRRWPQSSSLSICAMSVVGVGVDREDRQDAHDQSGRLSSISCARSQACWAPTGPRRTYVALVLVLVVGVDLDHPGLRPVVGEVLERGVGVVRGVLGDGVDEAHVNSVRVGWSGRVHRGTPAVAAGAPVCARCWVGTRSGPALVGPGGRRDVRGVVRSCRLCVEAPVHGRTWCSCAHSMPGGRGVRRSPAPSA